MRTAPWGYPVPDCQGRAGPSPPIAFVRPKKRAVVQVGIKEEITSPGTGRPWVWDACPIESRASLASFEESPTGRAAHATM